MQDHIFPLPLQYLCAPSPFLSSPFPTSISLFFSRLCFIQFDFSPFSLSSVSSLQSFPLSFAVTLLCLSVFSKLFHVQTGNNQAFTRSSRVEWGPHPQYTCQRLLYSVGDKHTPIHTQRTDSHMHCRVQSGQ